MYLILLSILAPVLTGIFLLIRKEYTDRRYLIATAAGGFILTGALLLAAVLTAYGTGFELFRLTKTLPVVFAVDDMSVLFSTLTSVVFLCAGLFPLNT